MEIPLTLMYNSLLIKNKNWMDIEYISNFSVYPTQILFGYINPLYTGSHSSIILCWNESIFHFRGVKSIFYRFYSIFDGKSC